MNLDLRTILVVSSILTLLMIFYLFLVWLNNRKEHNEILLFLTGMLLLAVSSIGVSLQGVTHPVFSIVFSNMLVVLGPFLLYISLRKFFNLTNSYRMIICIGLILLMVLVEQIVFTFFIPNVKVRIVAMMVFMTIPMSLSLVLLVQNRKSISLPGLLLICSFAILVFVTVAAIPIQLLSKSHVDTLLNIKGLYLYVVVTYAMAISAWPIGFSLLISYRLQQTALQQSREKSMLNKELFHRTRNNMQVVKSFVSLQQDFSTSPEEKDGLLDVLNRIDVMSLVHEKLNEANDNSNLFLKEYIQDLVARELSNFDVADGDIIIRTEVDDIKVLIDIAIPVGLLINELISNSIRHAFPDKRGTIFISIMKKDEDLIVVDFQDNGIGFPAEFDFNNSSTLGMKIINSIAEMQLHGKIEFASDNGAHCHIEFRNKIYSERI